MDHQDLPSFDILLDIARNDPRELERIRTRLTYHTINSAPRSMRARLRGLQFQIDLRRQLAKTPLSSCIQLTEMMHQSFEELRVALNSPPASEPASPHSADIIPFQLK